MSFLSTYDPQLRQFAGHCVAAGQGVKFLKNWHPASIAYQLLELTLHSCETPNIETRNNNVASLTTYV